MKTAVLRSLLFVMIGFTTTVAQANEIDNLDTSHLQRMGFKVESVRESSIQGLYEVITNQGLIYVSPDGQQLMSGRIYDITGAQPENVSDVTLNAMRRSNLAEQADTAIEFKAPKEKYVVSVFTDPTCGYCRQLHQQIDSYLDAGITIRYYAWPRSGLQGSAFNQLNAIWCATNPQDAMTRAKADKSIQQGNCETPVKEHFEMGQKFGVRGTPALVLADGRMLPGYLPPSRLLQELQ
ncbi:MAG TPA: bifunctional protein-disulfide isomerase/oxidoreductase DsbC [Pseudidiomarina sp.]|nr:bifunctional protein-disulfide isomerase/oxidoreductase DsbC [Pseudidiomarina sp.]